MSYKGEKAYLKYARRIYAKNPELRDVMILREEKRRKDANKKRVKQEKEE